MDHAWWFVGWAAGAVVVLLVALLLVVIVLFVRRISDRADQVTERLVAVRDNVAPLHDLSTANYELVRIARAMGDRKPPGEES